MRGKDSLIVALILAAALAAGLWLVHLGVDRAREEREAALAAAAAPAASSEEAESGDTSSSASADGAASAGPSPQSAGQTEKTESGGDAAPSAGAVQTAAVQETPSLGAGAITLKELTVWMQSESGEALSVKARLAAAQALAAGVGTDDDPERRDFAKSQAGANEQAERNRLAETAAALGFAYLKCRDGETLQEESAAFYGALAAAVQSAVSRDDGTDAARTAKLKEDAALAEDWKAEAEKALSAAKKNLQSAVQTLNTAVGNEVTADTSLTDPLTQTPLPDLTEEEAVALAVENRNEVTAAQYALSRESRTLTLLRYEVAPTAPEFIKQQAAVQAAKNAEPRARSEVESAVRDQFSRLQTGAESLAEIAKQLETAGETAPAATYTPADEGEKWISNLTDLKAQWDATMALRQKRTEETAAFNMEVVKLQNAVGVGCVTVEI